MAETVDAETARPAPRAEVLLGRAGGLAPLALLLLPLGAGLWMAGHGGGYTVDEWGLWSAATALAVAVVLIAVEPPRLGVLPWVAPAALAAIGVYGWLSVGWADWPENALVEGDRFVFYACAFALALLALGLVEGRRVAVWLAAGSAGLIALLQAWMLWTNGDVGAFSFGRLVGGIGYGGGMAALVAIGVWPLIALASERGTPIALRLAAALGAGAGAALVIPTGARAALFALIASGVVFLLVTPTPIRCTALVAPATVVIGLRWHELNAAFAPSAGSSQAKTVGAATLLTAVVCAAAALIQALLDRRVRLGAEARRMTTAVATAVVICGVLLALGGFSITVSGGPGGFVHDKWHEFQQQGSPYRGDADSRFGSVGTGRYDLWRAAVLIFRDHPLHGIGAGNFLSDYAILGRSTDQPFHAHSEFLETASTLGIPGLLGFTLAVGLPLAAAIRLRFRGATAGERLLAAAMAGGLSEFLLHAAVDWTWQLAACVMPALLLAAAACASLPRPAGPPPKHTRTRRIAMLVVPAVIVGGVAISTIPPALAQAYLLRSYGQPLDAAISSANTADEFDWFSGRPQIAIARAALRNGDARTAYEASRLAVTREPEFWVGWQMLYLSAVRLGRPGVAQHALSQVRRLNPSLRLDFRFIEPPVSYDHY